MKLRSLFIALIVPTLFPQFPPPLASGGHNPILHLSSQAATTFTTSQGKGENSPSVWTNIIQIQRPAKSGQPRSRRRYIRAPLLTIEYRVLKRSEDGTAQETNPGTIFHTGDRLQLRVRPNQNGYLHIIQNTEGEDGLILFPDSRIKNGKNFVSKNEEIIVPAECESLFRFDDGTCWFEVQEPAGREIFTVIFSREALPDVVGRIHVVGGTVKQDVINEIKETSTKSTSRPDLSPRLGGGAGGYAIWVTNINNRNNEELIEKIVLNHKEREGSTER